MYDDDDREPDCSGRCEIAQELEDEMDPPPPSWAPALEPASRARAEIPIGEG